MEKKRFIFAMALTLTVALGTISATALPARGVDATSGATQKTAVTDETAQRQKTFTTQELSAYNGENGNKAYIAVNGTVYDVTALFQNGSHHGAQAGKDLTAAFEDEHSASRLTSFPVVGALNGGSAANQNPLTDQEQTRFAELLQAERELEKKEDALEQSYYSGEITHQEYLSQEADLDKQEDGFESELDALEEKADVDYDDPDDDRDDDRDDDPDDDRDDD